MEVGRPPQSHHAIMFQCCHTPSLATAACSLGLLSFDFCAGKEKGLNSFVDFVPPVPASSFLWIFFFSSYCSFSHLFCFCPLLVFISPSPIPLHLQTPLLLSLFLVFISPSFFLSADFLCFSSDVSFPHVLQRQRQCLAHLRHSFA